MKGIIDKELKIIIKNEIANYNHKAGCLLNKESLIATYRKNGFLVYDQNGRNIGLVFMSDDTRKFRFGNAEILFFKEFQQEFGVWRIIKINGNYLSFEKLKRILQIKNEYICITDERMR